MTPSFPRIVEAIYCTIKFYNNPYLIKAHLAYYSGDEINDNSKKWLDFHYRTAIEAHKDMEAEIRQTVYTADAYTRSQMFDFLIFWVNDSRIASLNKSLILQEIDNYNKKVLKEFEQKIEARIKKLPNGSQFFKIPFRGVQRQRIRWNVSCGAFNWY